MTRSIALKSMYHEMPAYLVFVLRFSIRSWRCTITHLGLLLLRPGQELGSMTFASTFPVLGCEADLAEVIGASFAEHLGGLVYISLFNPAHISSYNIHTFAFYTKAMRDLLLPLLLVPPA